ncbi:MAG: DUF6816 family protein [Cyanophyceae cyanobacterium]
MRFWSVPLIVLILLWTMWTMPRAIALSSTSLDEFSRSSAIQPATGDLEYPDWMAGTWEVTSTLVAASAPLAPEIVSPGFESNRRTLNQPFKFQVRFRTKYAAPRTIPVPSLTKLPVVADRAFNGLKIAEAYLGEDAVLSVKGDPDTPNRQITRLASGQLISTITRRGSQSPSADEFTATEICQQIFRSRSQIYLNEVATTTTYRHTGDRIAADQTTAIYLSPQDPNYFRAAGRPVAHYRYRLELVPVDQLRMTNH